MKQCNTGSVNFKQIPFLPRYYVGDDGTFIDSHKGTTVATHFSNILTVNLRSGERWVKLGAAKCVADLFIDKPVTKSKLLVGYIDSNKKNISSSNLMWISSSELQSRIFKEKINLFRGKYSNYPTDVNDGWYPNAVECSDLKGYYFIPYYMSTVVISKQGKLFNLEKGKPHPTRITPKGYEVTALYNPSKNKYIDVRVHRLVARLFIQIPKLYSNLPHDELQVNHKDGIKTNNDHVNLEWIDNDGNMKHARMSGLFSNETPVLAKCLKSGKVTNYVSISECARDRFISGSVLHKHVTSQYAGMIQKDGYVFKLDDNTTWPDSLAEITQNDTFSAYCDVVAINTDTGKIHIFISIVQACSYLKLNLNSVRNSRHRNGIDYPYLGWIFKTLNDYLKDKDLCNGGIL